MEHVAIVENRKGSRFPTNIKNLIEVNDEKLKSIMPLNDELMNIKDRKTTSANNKKISVLEQKINQILNS